jgi:NAD(P)-dependent dehydrogenase (short-subunit alcohol dehydrogenase family)
MPEARKPRLDGLVAIVTGAGSEGPAVEDGRAIGNGKATALLFTREGARVALLDRSIERARETEEMIRAEGGEAFSVQGDVTSSDDCRRVVEETVRRYGRLDILHNNVGILGPGNVVDVDEDFWDHVMNVNLKGMVLMSKHAVPVIAAGGGGSVINISSLAALRPRGITPYSVSKGAVITLTKAMAVDHAAQGIRVNCIVPGPVFTPRIAAQTDDERRARRAKASLLGIEGNAWDIAWAAVFFASPESRWVTGQVLPVDGGSTLVGPSRSPN